VEQRDDGEDEACAPERAAGRSRSEARAQGHERRRSDTEQRPVKERGGGDGDPQTMDLRRVTGLDERRELRCLRAGFVRVDRGAPRRSQGEDDDVGPSQQGRTRQGVQGSS
jgi:hypothetical protein